jgi:hypothetical protein
MAENSQTNTCLEGVQEVDLRDKFASALFSKFEECETEKDLKNKIIEILDDNNIDFEANASFTQYKSKLAQYVNCALTETAVNPQQPDRTIQLSQLVTGIVSFLCNPPKFEFPKLKFELKLSMFLKSLINAIIDSLIQLLANLISSIISLSFDLCENNKLIDFDLRANINELLDFSAIEAIFGNYDIITQGNQALIQRLDSCESLYQPSEEEQNISNSQRPYRENSDGTRSRTARGSSPTNFISDLDLVINPLELCSLFEGVASDTTLDSVKELLRYEYPNLFTKLDNNEKITNLFKDIGNTLDPTVCESLRQLRTTFTVEDLCSQDYLRDLENKKELALRNKGFSEDITRELLNKERKKISDKHAQLVGTIGKLRDNPDRLFDDVEMNIFCKNGKPGLMSLSDIPKMDVVADIAMESIFSTLKTAHKMDFDGFADSKFVTSKPRKTFVKRYDQIEILDKDGNVTKTLKKAETSEYKMAKEGQSAILITQKKGFALKNEDDGDKPVTLAKLKVKLKKGRKQISVKNHKGKPKNYSLNQLYVADMEEFDSPKDFKKFIIGAVQEKKKKTLRSKHSRAKPSFIRDNTIAPKPILDQEDLNDGYTDDVEDDISNGYEVFTINTGSDSAYAKYKVGTTNTTGISNSYITLYDGRAKYYPSYLGNQGITKTPYVSDVSLLDLPEIIQKSDASLEIDDAQLVTVEKLTGIKITREQLQAPTLIYQKSNFTDGPYYKTSNGIKELVNVNLPNYAPQKTSISSEHDVFNQFYKKKATIDASNDLYLNCYANLMARQSFMCDLLAVDDEDKDDEILLKYPLFSGNQNYSYNKFANLITRIPYENIADYPSFQRQALEEFLNDPCAIKDDDELTDPSPLAGAVKIPTVRLLIRNHIMKFYNMFLNTLYFYKTERMYENSEIYIQFLIQTFKQDIKKLSLTGGRLSLGFYDLYFEYLNEYFESQITMSNGLFDPLTGQKVDLNQDFSEDYKLNYFFKLELQFLKNRYDLFLNSVRNEDASLIQMLNGLFIPEVYEKQLFLKFVIVNEDDVIMLTSDTESAFKDIKKAFYGVAIYVKDGSSIKPIIVKKQSTPFSTDKKVHKSNVLSYLLGYSISQTHLDVFKVLKEDKEFKILFDYTFSLSKILSTIHIENCLEIIEYDQFASNMLIASDEAIRNVAVRGSNKRVNRNGFLEDPAEQSDCWNPTSNLDSLDLFDLDNVNVSGMIKKLIYKIIIQTPIVILKSLVEMTDPNIAIASKLRTAASTITCEPLPVLPFSLSLLPFTLIPSPFSIGPPVLPPLGHIYLGVDMAEYFIAKKSGTKTACASLEFGESGDLNKPASTTLCKNGCSEAKYKNYKLGIDVSLGTDDCPEE